MQDNLQLDHKDHPVFKALPAIFRDVVAEGVSAKFCLDYPQQVGERICATDGRIMVRVAATPGASALIPDIAPKKFPEKSCTEMFEPRSAWEDTPTALPPLDRLARCVDCKGSGHLPQRRCVCEDDTPCHDRGIIPAGECWECDGTGIERAGLKSVTLRRDVDLSARYLYLLAKHGATLYLPVEANTSSSSRPAYFTVEGGIDGVCMPMAISADEWKARGTSQTQKAESSTP